MAGWPILAGAGRAFQIGHDEIDPATSRAGRRGNRAGLLIRNPAKPRSYSGGFARRGRDGGRIGFVSSGGVAARGGGLGSFGATGGRPAAAGGVARKSFRWNGIGGDWVALHLNTRSHDRF